MNLLKYNIYPTFREHQEETIKKIIDFVHNSRKKFLIVQSPTGSGKSIIGYVAAHYLVDEFNQLSSYFEENKNSLKAQEQRSKCVASAYLLTSKNLLLDQYDRDFNQYMKLLKGKNNYTCILDRRPCSEGICVSTSKKLECKAHCPYYLQKKRMLESTISATNFSLILKLMHNRDYCPRDLVVIDECQALESVLLDEYSVQITETTVKSMNELKAHMRDGSGGNICSYTYENFVDKNGNLRPINVKSLDITNFSLVNNFLLNLKQEIKIMHAALTKGIDTYVAENYGDAENADKDDKELKNYIKLADKLLHLISKIQFYLDLRDRIEWVTQEHKTDKGEITGFDIKPVTLDLLTENMFDKLANSKIVMMSATIGDPERFAKSLGIDYNDCEFIDVPSTFPIENRPFVILPVCFMNYQNMDKNMPLIRDTCDDIFDMFKGKKGIVHSVSFKNAIYLKRNCRNSNRILIHDQVTKDSVLEQFKKSTDKILISPSLIEGFDFKGNLSEFQIFIKVPYLSLGDNVVKRKKELDPEWYINSAIIQILQGVGRSVRSETDSAVTFCLDTNIKFLLSKYNHLFTKDFLSTVMESPSDAT